TPKGAARDDHERLCSGGGGVWLARRVREGRCGGIGGLRVGHVTHGVLGERGDREGGVDADVGGHGGAVADEQVFVAEDALARVDDAVPGVGGDDGAAEDVGGGGDVE